MTTIIFYKSGVKRVIRRNESGFTLIELFIAMSISAAVMAAVFMAYQSQQKSYVIQEDVAEMQQNLRAAMDMMVREIRMAGYDQTGTAGADISAATIGSITFTWDENDDGDCGDSGENITLGFSAANDADNNGIADSGAADLGRDTGGGFQPIAENISAIEFYYTLADGTQTTAPGTPANVRSVQITILARAERRRHGFQGDPSPSFTTPGGQTWPPSSDNFRHRHLTTTVRCRNMGL
jgi:type IV pilus assembly protein PilW